MHKYVGKLISLILDLLMMLSMASIVHGVSLYSVPVAYIVGGIISLALLTALRIAKEK